MMLAVHGYFDGEVFQPLEKTVAKPNQRVNITIMDDFVEKPDDNHNERIEKIERLCGSLAEYADANLVSKEKGAWERSAVEKYGNF